MPWKLIFFIICIVLATIFVGFNLENRCDVSFVFITFKQVPIFLSLTAAFVLGIFAALPFSFGQRKKKKLVAEKQKNVVPTTDVKLKSVEKKNKVSEEKNKEVLSSKETNPLKEEPKEK